MEDLNKAFNRQFLIPKGHFQGAELKSMEGKLWTNPEMPKLIKSFIRQREKELLNELLQKIKENEYKLGLKSSIYLFEKSLLKELSNE